MNIMRVMYLIFLTLLGHISAYGANFNGPGQNSFLRAQLLDYNISGTQYYYKEGNCSYNEYYITIRAMGTTDDDGAGNDEILIEIMDDGKLKSSKIISIPVGNTKTISTLLKFSGTYQTQAPGVGIYIYDDRNRNRRLAGQDPFIPNQVEENSCRTTNVTVPLSPFTLLLLIVLIGFFGYRKAYYSY